MKKDLEQIPDLKTSTTVTAKPNSRQRRKKKLNCNYSFRHKLLWKCLLLMFWTNFMPHSSYKTYTIAYIFMFSHTRYSILYSTLESYSIKYINAKGCNQNNISRHITPCYFYFFEKMFLKVFIQTHKFLSLDGEICAICILLQHTEKFLMK